jgi:SAM-dependent methyltransferase
MIMTHDQQLSEPPDAVYTVQHACRACGAAIEPFLALGDLPLANALVSLEKKLEEQTRYPLTMARCVSCALVQLLETVHPELLFRHYNYVSSNSSAFVRHAKDLVERLIVERGLNSQSQIVEIASNDGYLLDHYRAAGVPVLGIEPAVNIAHMARERGIETICDFFSQELAIQLARDGRTADVIHANNVLAHVPDLRGVVAGISALLRPDGIAVIEVPFWYDLVDRLAFDTVYHEHQFYFALSPLVPLFASQGLTIVDVERITVHGGSLRIFALPGEGRTARASVAALLADETALGVNDLRTYERFAADVGAFRQELRDFLARLRHQGKTIAAYGAAAKGATLLNYCGIGSETIDFVVDRSTLKQGLAMPGVQIPILAPGQLIQRRPDYLLLLAWNFAGEIMAQQSDYAGAGGRFILPVPHPRVIG